MAYFELVESTGAVATGVLQALRAVCVFGISHVWFCEQDSGQCYNSWKGLATVVVVMGVMAFAAAKGAKHHSHHHSGLRRKSSNNTMYSPVHLEADDGGFGRSDSDILLDTFNNSKSHKMKN
jgi:hypothetical protein